MEKPRAINDITGNGLQRPSGNHVAYGLDRYSYQQGTNAQFGFQIAENQEPALVAMGGAAVCCFTKRK